MAISEIARSVLVVDPSSDSREVLCTVLRQRGVETLEAGRVQRGVDLAQRHHPRVVVLDAETFTEEDTAVCDNFGELDTAGETSLIVLGRAGDAKLDRPHGHFVAKPYHYAPLIRTIERLLNLSPTENSS